MRSEKSIASQKKEKKSFIEEARRAQIIEAAIDTIALHGYSQTSLSKIAEYASISTSLILYHFKDKEDLMAAVLGVIISDWEEPARKAMEQVSSPSEKLRNYIEARLVYIGTRPKQSIALIELLFSSRPTDNMPAYRTEDKGFEVDEIVNLLEAGQKSGEFKQLNIDHMAIMIRSSIDQFLGYSQMPGIDLEAYVNDLLGWYGILIAKKGKL